MKNYLGIDWGATKVGLALADGETRMAFGYDTLKNNKKTILGELMEIIKKENIGTVVIGRPDYINKTEAIYPGEKLGEEIKKNITVVVVYQDEMFSTKIAQHNLKEKGMKNVGKIDDAEAARIILESYLEKIK